MELITEFFDFRCDDTKIFGNDRKIFSKRLFYGEEEIFFRAVLPGTVDCGLLSEGNCPISFKPTEMIDS